MEILYAYPRGLEQHPLIELYSAANPGTDKTELCRLMTLHGSDKASGHGYTNLYHRMLSPFRQERFTLFELGIGTTSASFRASMGESGVPGASLRAWRDYFPNAQIRGADIDRGVLFQDSRITTYEVDATSAASTRRMLTKAVDEGERIMIAVDDGPHLLSASLIFLMSIYPYLEKGGFHFIEDIFDHPEAILGYSELFDVVLSRLEMEWAAIVRVPHHSNAHDNCIAVFKK